MSKKRIFFVDGLTSVEAEELTNNVAYNGTIYFTDNGGGHGDIYKDGILYTYICGVNDDKNSLSPDGGQVILSYNDDSHYLQMYSYNIFPDEVNITYSSCIKEYNQSYAYLLLSDDRYMYYDYNWQKTNSNVVLSQQNNQKNLCKIYVKNCNGSFTDTIKCTLTYTDPDTDQQIRHVASSKLNVRYNPLTGLYLYPEVIYIEKSNNRTINVDYTPDDTNDTDLTFNCANTSIATVTKTGIVTGVNEGHTTVNATCNGITSNTVTIHVIPEISAKKLIINVADGYGDSLGNQTNDPTNCTYIKSTFYPSTSTNKNRNWKLLDDSICKIVAYGTSISGTNSHAITPCGEYTVDGVSFDYVKLQAVNNKIGTTLITCEHLDETGNLLYDYRPVNIVPASIEAYASGNAQMRECNNTNNGGAAITQIQSDDNTFATFTCDYAPANASFTDNENTYMMLKNVTSGSTTTEIFVGITNNTKIPVNMNKTSKRFYTHQQVKNNLRRDYDFEITFYSDGHTPVTKTGLKVLPSTFDDGELTINTNNTLYAGCQFKLTVTSNNFLNVWNDVYNHLTQMSSNVFDFTNATHSESSDGKTMTVTGIKVSADASQGMYDLQTYVNNQGSSYETQVYVQDIELTLSKNQFMEQTQYTSADNININSSINNVFTQYTSVSGNVDYVSVSSGKLNISSRVHDADVEEVTFNIKCDYRNSGNITGGDVTKSVKLYFYRVYPTINVIAQQLDITVHNPEPYIRMAQVLNVSTSDDIGQHIKHGSWYIGNDNVSDSVNYKYDYDGIDQVTITLKYGTRSVEYVVEFYSSYISATSITLSTPPNLYINSTDKITTTVVATVTPANHTGSVSWTGTPENISLSTDNKTLTIRANGSSSKKYTIQANIDDKTATREMYIYSIRLNDISVKKDGTTINQSTTVFKNINSVYTLNATRDILLNNSTVSGTHGYNAYTWSSSNTSIAKITSGGTLDFTGCNQTGQVTFTCSLNDTTLTKTVTLNVEDAYITLLNDNNTNVNNSTQTLYTNSSPKTYNIKIQTNLTDALNVTTNNNNVTVNKTTVSNNETITCTAANKGQTVLTIKYGSTNVKATVNFNVQTLITEICFTMTTGEDAYGMGSSMSWTDTTKTIDLFTDTDFTLQYEILPANASYNDNPVAPTINKTNNLTGSDPNYHTSSTASATEYLKYMFKDVNNAQKIYTINLGNVDFDIMKNNTVITNTTQTETYTSNNTGKTLSARVVGSRSTNTLQYVWKLNNVQKTTSNTYNYQYTSAVDAVTCMLTTNFGISRAKYVRYEIFINNFDLNINYVLYAYSYDTMNESHGSGFKLPLLNIDSGGGTYGDNGSGFIYTKNAEGSNEGHRRFSFEARDAYSSSNTDGVKLYCTHNNDGTFYRTPNLTILYTLKNNQTVHTIYHLLGNKRYGTVTTSTPCIPYDVSTNKISGNILDMYGDLQTTAGCTFTQYLEDVNGNTNGFVETAIASNNSISDTPAFFLRTNNELIDNTLTLNLIFSMNGHEPMFNTITLSETEYNDGSGNNSGGGNGNNNSGTGGEGTSSTPWASDYVNIYNAYYDYEFFEAGTNNGDDLYNVTVHFEMEPIYPNSVASNPEQTIVVSIGGISTNVGNHDVSDSVTFRPGDTEYKHFNFNFSLTATASPGEIKNVTVDYSVWVDNFTGQGHATHNGSSSSDSFEI